MKVVTWILGVMLVLGSGVYWTIIYRFQNPHLTESQLFLDKWWLIFPMIIGLILVLWNDAIPK